jgi:membrane-bound lytic murein transglycosylase B
VSGSALADGSFTGRDRFDLDRPEIRQFVETTAAEQKMQPLDVYRLLAKAEPQPKIIELISKPGREGCALVAIPRPLPHRAAHQRRRAVHAGTSRAPRARPTRDTGVAPEYVVAIIGVETFYGRITGKYRVLDALATLAFDYSPRAEFFKSELGQFIALSNEEKVDPLTAMGSYAGAMGASQFMPSSYRRYAVDGNGDDQRDLFADWDDIIASVANYFAKSGWVANGPVLADAVLQPDAPVVADPGNLSLNETVAGLKAKGVDFDPASQVRGRQVLLVPAETQLGPVVPRRLQELRSHHALQPQRALRHGRCTISRRPSRCASPPRTPRAPRTPRTSPRASRPGKKTAPRAECGKVRGHATLPS